MEVRGTKSNDDRSLVCALVADAADDDVAAVVAAQLIPHTQPVTAVRHSVR